MTRLRTIRFRAATYDEASAEQGREDGASKDFESALAKLSKLVLELGWGFAFVVP
jgi:hypothetical protein